MNSVTSSIVGCAKNCSDHASKVFRISFILEGPPLVIPCPSGLLVIRAEYISFISADLIAVWCNQSPTNQKGDQDKRKNCKYPSIFPLLFMNDECFIFPFPFLLLSPNTQTELGTSTLLSPFSDKHVNTVLQLYNSTNRALYTPPLYKSTASVCTVKLALSSREREERQQ